LFPRTTVCSLERLFVPTWFPSDPVWSREPAARNPSAAGAVRAGASLVFEAARRELTQLYLVMRKGSPPYTLFRRSSSGGGESRARARR
jgi:hypothetical protein